MGKLLDLYGELVEIRVLMDENPPKAKQKLTNFLKEFLNKFKDTEVIP